MKGIGAAEISGAVDRLGVGKNMWRRMERDMTGEW
jgi:hypothetical protein